MKQPVQEIAEASDESDHQDKRKPIVIQVPKSRIQDEEIVPRRASR